MRDPDATSELMGTRCNRQSQGRSSRSFCRTLLEQIRHLQYDHAGGPSRSYLMNR